jgi:hypothetical protein
MYSRPSTTRCLHATSAHRPFRGAGTRIPIDCREEEQLELVQLDEGHAGDAREVRIVISAILEVSGQEISTAAEVQT